MDICGEGREPGRAHFSMLAEKAGIHSRDFVEIVDEVVVTAQQFKSEAKNWPIRSSTINTIYQAIHANSIRLQGK
jgi:serine/threonine-protein kinase HipA